MPSDTKEREDTTDLHGLERQTGGRLPATTAKGLSGSSSSELPAHVSIARNHGALEVTVRLTNGWRRWVYLVAFIGFVGVTVLNLGRSPTIGFDIITGGLAIFGLYHLSAAFLNKAVLTVDSRKLIVKRGPIRVDQRERIISSDDIAQLFVKKEVTGGGTQQSVDYILALELKDGSEIDLVTQLDSIHQGRVIEEQLEKELGIADREVAGESEFHDKAAYGFGKGYDDT